MVDEELTKLVGDFLCCIEFSSAIHTVSSETYRAYCAIYLQQMVKEQKGWNGGPRGPIYKIIYDKLRKILG